MFEVQVGELWIYIYVGLKVSLLQVNNTFPDIPWLIQKSVLSCRRYLGRYYLHPPNYPWKPLVSDNLEISVVKLTLEHPKSKFSHRWLLHNRYSTIRNRLNPKIWLMHNGSQNKRVPVLVVQVILVVMVAVALLVVQVAVSNHVALFPYKWHVHLSK